MLLVKEVTVLSVKIAHDRMLCRDPIRLLSYALFLLSLLPFSLTCMCDDECIGSMCLVHELRGECHVYTCHSEIINVESEVETVEEEENDGDATEETEVKDDTEEEEQIVVVAEEEEEEETEVTVEEKVDHVDSVNESYVLPPEENVTDVKMNDTGKETYSSRRIDTRHRMNYASISLGAKVLDGGNCRGVSNLLQESRDKYMRCLCMQHKQWITVELSEEVRMDTIQTANWEFYTSSFREFVLLRAPQYPCRAPHCRWQNVGYFMTHNTKELQTFQLQTPVWTRYLRVVFLSHHGTEQYCTFSLIRVFGSTLIEDLRVETEDSGKTLKTKTSSSSYKASSAPTGMSLVVPHSNSVSSMFMAEGNVIDEVRNMNLNDNGNDAESSENGDNSNIFRSMVQRIRRLEESQQVMQNGIVEGWDTLHGALATNVQQLFDLNHGQSTLHRSQQNSGRQLRLLEKRISELEKELLVYRKEKERSWWLRFFSVNETTVFQSWKSESAPSVIRSTATVVGVSLLVIILVRGVITSSTPLSRRNMVHSRVQSAVDPSENVMKDFRRTRSADLMGDWVQEEEEDGREDDDDGSDSGEEGSANVSVIRKSLTYDPLPHKAQE